jgi:2-oxo-4-hydroxy-4-carboxy-5-ureidoimidazoline decarboxylase
LKRSAQRNIVNNVLGRWNQLPDAQAESEILPCCGSRVWAHGMVQRRPISDKNALLSASDEIWRSLSERDWNEAFQSHPRIGESKTQQPVDQQSAAWSKQEQTGVSGEADATQAGLAEGNREYEQRFGRIFIVCATGKTGGQILEILRQRLQNDPPTELREVAEQQRQVTQLRLRKWIGE